MGLKFTKNQALALFYTQAQVNALIAGVGGGSSTGDLYVGIDLTVTGDMYALGDIYMTGDLVGFYVQEGGSNVITTVKGLNFNSTDFDITDEGGGIAGIAYAGAGGAAFDGTFTGDVYFGSNLYITGDIILGGSLDHGSLSGLSDPDHVETSTRLTGTYTGHLAGQTDLLGALGALDDLVLGEVNVPQTRQIGWYMDGEDVTGDILAYQPLFYGEGPYNLTSANVDYRTAPTSEATWEIECCDSGDFLTTPSWTSIFTTAITVDADELSSQSATTPYVFTGDLPEGARLRVRCTTPGAGDSATVTLVIIGTT